MEVHPNQKAYSSNQRHPTELPPLRSEFHLRQSLEQLICFRAKFYLSAVRGFHHQANLNQVEHNQSKAL